MDTEKAKHKGSPPNLRRYWRIFGLIAILLIIPFRVVPYWTAMAYTYIAISILIGLSILHFIWRYDLRHRILILMLICSWLPLSQINLIDLEKQTYGYDGWMCTSEEQGIFTISSCKRGEWHCSPGVSEYITVQNLPVSILISPDYISGNIMGIHCILGFGSRISF